MKRFLKYVFNFKNPVEIVGIAILASKISYRLDTGAQFAGYLRRVVDNNFVVLLCFTAQGGFNKLIYFLEISF